MRVLIRFKDDIRMLVYVSKIFFYDGCLQLVGFNDKDSIVRIPMNINIANEYMQKCTTAGFVDLTKYMAETNIVDMSKMDVF